MRRFRLLGGMSLAALAVGFSGTAYAQTPTAGAAQSRANTQETAETLDEVVVTARRRTERLSDVPVAASVIDAETAENRGGITSGLEALAGQAGVRFSNTTSVVSQEVSIRGSGTARGTTADSAVGLYRNDAYIGGGAIGGRNFQRIDFFDVGTIEVLRGTQGALFGRNAVGGVVHVRSAEPRFENSGYLDFKYGTQDESLQIQAVGNFQLNDMFAARVGVETVGQTGGFYYNPNNDVFFDAQQGYNARAQLLFKNGATKINFLAERQDMDLPSVYYRIENFTSTSFPTGRPYSDDPYTYYWDTEPRVEFAIDNYIIDFEHDLGWAKLEATAMWREREGLAQVDLDAISASRLADLRAVGRATAASATAVTDSAQTTLDTTLVMNQDVRLSGGGDRLTWLVGIEHYDMESNSEVVNTRPTPGTRRFNDIQLKSYAAYGLLDFALTDRIRASVEARQTYDDKQFGARSFVLTTGVPSTARLVSSAESSPENLSYNLILSYRPFNQGLLYAKYGTSYRAGGFNTNLGDIRAPIPIPDSFDDETAATAEIGFKMGSRRTTMLNFSAYHTLSENVIVQRGNGCFVGNAVCPVVETTFLDNAGEAEIQGVELELSHAFDLLGWGLRVGVTGSHQKNDITAGPFEALSLAQIPDYVAGAEINGRYDNAGPVQYFFNVNYSAQWGGVQELTTTTFPLYDYQLVNARAGITVGNVSLSVFGNNIFDQSYYVFRGPGTSRTNQPTLVGVQLRARY